MANLLRQQRRVLPAGAVVESMLVRARFRITTPVLRIYMEQIESRGGSILKGLPEERAIMFAHYIIDHNATVRDAAKEFHISKSTIHKDVTDRLRRISPSVHEQVKVVLEHNKSERHIRGGIATREKYARIKGAPHPVH